ncbi:hypothetical protein XH93_22265 [Bradyrhizobium sp. CCBAU 51753]|nr:hypothetical protein XH93_22265 [Bradyrhizobium sp. CCBAU 51753]
MLHRAHGCDRHPAFPAPSVLRAAKRNAKLGQSCRENAKLHPHPQLSSPGSTGRSSTPRPLGSITAASGILDHPLSRVMTPRRAARPTNRLGTRVVQPHTCACRGGPRKSFFTSSTPAWRRMSYAVAT